MKQIANPEDFNRDNNWQFLIYDFSGVAGAVRPSDTSNTLDKWMLSNGWDIDEACKLITMGFAPDLDGLKEYLKGKSFDSKNWKRLDAMVLVYDRIRYLADSAVKAGTIKDPDTPANWIEWAQEKGYSVAHLMPAVAPAAKVEADTSPSGDEIPGKMPRTNIGKLAIKAAWQIECDTKKRATAKQVIEKLQAWIKTEPELVETIPHGVKWTTTKGKQKSFDIEACAKALEIWQASRA